MKKLGLFPSSEAKGVRRILIFGSLTDNAPNVYPNTGVSPLFLSEDEIRLSFWNTPRQRKMNKTLVEPEALALQRCYAAYVGSWLQKFWDSLSIRFWVTNQSKKNNWLNWTGRLFRKVDNHHLRRVTCRRSQLHRGVNLNSRTSQVYFSFRLSEFLRSVKTL